MPDDVANGRAPVAEGGDTRERPALDPEQEARRRRALSMIRTFGDPALKARAVDITSFDEKLQNEIARMGELMEDALGVGLAATQLGVMHRVLVYKTSPEAPLIAIVNPELEWESDVMESAEEGCLSLPGVAVDVDRPLYVRLKAQDENGADLTVEASGLEARVLQHEIDHLNGVLMIDRATKEQRREALRVLREGPDAAAPRAAEVSPA
jgi:peptide deformylase